MAKVRPYPRQVLGRRFRAWSKTNRILLAAVFVGAALLLAIETMLLLAFFPQSDARSYILGAVHTFVIGAMAFLVYSAFLAHDREAIWHVRGAWGEENTSSELSRARRKRVIWAWVDNVPLQRGDIDHVVITRRGGIVAVDSKWRHHIDIADRDAIVRDASKVRLRAEGLVRSVLKAENGSHRAKVSALKVTPVVVVWGASQHELPSGAQSDGIAFVGGRQFVSWLRDLDGEPVDKDAAADVVRRLKGYRKELSRRYASPVPG